MSRSRSRDSLRRYATIMPPVNEWSMPSNSGWAHITFSAIVLHEAADLIEFSVTLASENWYRPGFHEEPPNWANLVKDVEVSLFSVLIPRTECGELLNDFDNWLGKRTPFARSLGPGSGQALAIEIGEMDSLICTREQPVFRVWYEAGSFRFEESFTVDQSCVRIARNGLELVLRSFQEKLKRDD